MISMRRAGLLIMLVAAVPALAGDDAEFTLGLESLRLSSLDPRTEARLAQWNSPLGRVENHVRQQQAQIMAGGQPGGPPGAIAFRVKVQGGLDPRVVAATSVAGVQLYERPIDVIRWPWKDSDEPALSFEEQLSLMLGDRLRRSVGATD
jgi:hypothetical protein